MHATWGRNVRHGLGASATGVVAFIALVWVSHEGTEGWLHLSRSWQDHAGALGAGSLGEGVVGGVYVAVAACAAMVSWRRHSGQRAGSLVATGALVAAQALVVTLLAVRGATSPGPVGAWLLVVAATGALVVLLPLRRLHRVDGVIDEPFAIGLGAGMVAAGHLLLQLASYLPPTQLMALLAAVVAATHAGAVAAVVRQRVLGRAETWLLVATVLVVGPGQAVGAVTSSTVPDLVVTLGRAAVGAAWLALAVRSLQRALEEDRRRIESLEKVIVDSTRDQRERLHELRSTVAGLVTGSALLDRDDLSAETRERLWGSVRRELDRLERLLSGRETPAADLDIDEALGMILDLQRLKGRHVELHSSGGLVRARFDSLAEVVNVLMDNAAVHGGADRSVVEVVRRDEDNVDIRVTDYGCGIPVEQRSSIFEWGRRGTRSPGEGIGLNHAQRLMTEDGGSLRLDEKQDVGSSFVITLPAARRSPENGVTYEDSHDCRITG